MTVTVYWFSLECITFHVNVNFLLKTKVPILAPSLNLHCSVLEKLITNILMLCFVMMLCFVKLDCYTQYFSLNIRTLNNDRCQLNIMFRLNIAKVTVVCFCVTMNAR